MTKEFKLKEALTQSFIKELDTLEGEVSKAHLEKVMDKAFSRQLKEREKEANKDDGSAPLSVNSTAPWVDDGDSWL
jgi:hypothetical protein